MMLYTGSRLKQRFTVKGEIFFNALMLSKYMHTVHSHASISRYSTSMEEGRREAEGNA